MLPPSERPRILQNGDSAEDRTPSILVLETSAPPFMRQSHIENISRKEDFLSVSYYTDVNLAVYIGF